MGKVGKENVKEEKNENKLGRGGWGDVQTEREEEMYRK